jgi:L-seryl-tRNA(Ser) seleniumtransferase
MLQRFVIAGVLVAEIGLTFAAPANVAGRWNVSLELGSIVGHPTLDLKQDGDKITGTYRGRYGPSPLEGAVKDNHIGFTVTLNAEGQESSGYFAGTVEGDRMSGTVEFEGAGEGTWSATRSPARKE